MLPLLQDCIYHQQQMQEVASSQLGFSSISEGMIFGAIIEDLELGADGAFGDASFARRYLIGERLTFNQVNLGTNGFPVNVSGSVIFMANSNCDCTK